MDKINISALKKLKNERKTVGKCAEQIVSPIAKYDAKGNLFCIICKNQIKSASIWKVHVNSKLHKANVEEAKKLDKKILEKSMIYTENKNSAKVPQATATKKSRELISTVSKTVISSSAQKHNISSTIGPKESDDLLPEKFFDDPVVDAKVRNVEYKNAQDDEWERFQREIKEESVTSSKLIYGEQANAAVEREITEISEQIHQWSKVIDLEHRLQKIVKTEKRNGEVEESDEEVSDIEDIEENLDWRSKKLA